MNERSTIYFVFVLNGTPNGRYALPAMGYIGPAGTAYKLWGGSEWGRYARRVVGI